MSNTTYEEFLRLDPTHSFLFKAGMVLNRVLGEVRARVVVGTARLCFLGFYEDFIAFVEAIDQAEARSATEAEWRRVWQLRLSVADKIGKLINRIEALEGLRYRGRQLIDYVIGRERLEQLRIFVRATRLDEQAELAMQQSKKDFLSAFGKRTLTKTQRTAFLEKYRELSQQR